MRSENKKGARTACAIFLMLLSLAFWLLAASVRQACALLPDAYEFSNRDGLGFSFASLSAQDGNAGQRVAAFAEKGVYPVQYGEKTQRLRLLYTQGDAADILGIRMLYGTFLRVQSLAPEENHVIVIDAALAQAFFFTPDCIGRTLEVGGTTYTVCGVYEATEGFLSDLCGDGLSAAFIPATLSEPRTQRVEHVFCRKGAIRFADGARDTVAALAGQQPAADYTGDHAETKAFLHGCVRFVWMLASVAGCLIAGALLSGAVSFRTRGGCCLRRRRLFCGAALLALGVFGWRASDFSLSLPAAWTPQDNIFDVSFYWKAYTGAWQAVHSGAADYFLNRCTLCAFGVCICLTLLCAALTVCAAAAGLRAVRRLTPALSCFPPC